MDLLDWEVQQSDHFTRMAYAKEVPPLFIVLVIIIIIIIGIENRAEDIGDILESTTQKLTNYYTSHSLTLSLTPQLPPSYLQHTPKSPSPSSPSPSPSSLRPKKPPKNQLPSPQGNLHLSKKKPLPSLSLSYKTDKTHKEDFFFPYNNPIVISPLTLAVK